MTKDDAGDAATVSRNDTNISEYDAPASGNDTIITEYAVPVSGTDRTTSE